MSPEAARQMSAFFACLLAAYYLCAWLFIFDVPGAPGVKRGALLWRMIVDTLAPTYGRKRYNIGCVSHSTPPKKGQLTWIVQPKDCPKCNK